MELRIYKVAQAASGGSHVTIFEAEVELVPGGVRVEIAATHPPDADPADTAAAREPSARSGAGVAAARPRCDHPREAASHPPGRLQDVRFEQYTAEEFARVLEADT